ncbi:MAG TPA: LytR C-terminal domain-containing protein [Gemmatimonadales bacterium]|nr:LytR C-terminal domain-containing protein [Gemmatimonadales bacterium]
MGILERARGGRLLVVALIGLGLAAASFSLWWHGRHHGDTGVARPVPGERDRVVVEVLNTTPGVGLARAGARVLRDAGIDVVYFGSDTGAVLDSTQVLVRRGTADGAERVVAALGVGRVRQLPDPGRLVDVTVRIGRDFAARLAARHS